MSRAAQRVRRSRDARLIRAGNGHGGILPGEGWIAFIVKVDLLAVVPRFFC